MEYPQGQVDPQVHQPVEEYLSNQPPAIPPQNDFSTQHANEEFVMRQANEFIPQQKQQQLQPNEFIGNLNMIPNSMDLQATQLMLCFFFVFFSFSTYAMK